MKYVFAALALAETLSIAPVVSVAAENCVAASTQSELDRCARESFEVATEEINGLYNATLAKYDAKNQALLRNAERAWIAFRDSECAFRNAGNVGSNAWPTAHFDCLTELTRERIKQLKAASECQAGDLSCNQNSDSGAD